MGDGTGVSVGVRAGVTVAVGSEVAAGVTVAVGSEVAAGATISVGVGIGVGLVPPPPQAARTMTPKVNAKILAEIDTTQHIIGNTHT